MLPVGKSNNSHQYRSVLDLISVHEILDPLPKHYSFPYILMRLLLQWNGAFGLRFVFQRAIYFLAFSDALCLNCIMMKIAVY